MDMPKPRPVKKKDKVSMPKPRPKPAQLNEQIKSPYTIKNGKMVLDPVYKSNGGMIFKGR